MHPVHSQLERGPLRGMRLVLCGWLVLGSTGCLRSILQPESNLVPVESNLSQQDLVEHLNANIRQLHSWRCTNARVAAKTPLLPVKLTLSAQISVERERNFRLRASSALTGEEADFGSNAERFWFWLRRGDPFVFTARHEDLPGVVQRLPIPFQPDWVMEALGVREIDPAKITLRQPGPEPNSVMLVMQDTGPTGQPVRREVLVDQHWGVVLGHVLYDPAGGLVARAQLSGHHREPSGVVMPHRVHLEFPQTGMELTIDLHDIEVNPSHLPSQMWQPPVIPDAPPFDMGERLLRAGPRGLGVSSVVTPQALRQVAEAPANMEPPPFADSSAEPAGWQSRSGGKPRPEPMPLHREVPPF